MQRVNERAEICPLPDTVGQRDCVAKQRARRGSLDFEMPDARRRWSVPRVPADERNRADVDPGRARGRRKSPARHCRDGRNPIPAARLRARTQSTRRVGASEHRRAHRPRQPPRPRLPRCRQARSASGRPFRSRQRDAAAFAERLEQRPRGDAGSIARRIARQTSTVGRDAVDREPWPAKCAVTSSPGPSIAKPSASNPHPTFDTVAGANAVTEHGRSILLIADFITKSRRAPRDSVRGFGYGCRAFTSVALANRRDEVFAERPVEIVAPARIPSRHARPCRRRQPATNRRCPGVSHRPRM